MTDPGAIPYRTGVYLIFDNDAARPAKDGHFRSGGALDPPLHASGGHQFDARMLPDLITRITTQGLDLRRLLIVDLRQESHIFINSRAVSWCADKDWSNVGQSPAWIDRDERCHVQKFAVAPDAVVFTIRKGLEGEIQVVGTTPVHVTLAETEEA